MKAVLSILVLSLSAIVEAVADDEEKHLRVVEASDASDSSMPVFKQPFEPARVSYEFEIEHTEEQALVQISYDSERYSLTAIEISTPSISLNIPAEYASKVIRPDFGVYLGYEISKHDDRVCGLTLTISHESSHIASEEFEYLITQFFFHRDGLQRVMTIPQVGEAQIWLDKPELGTGCN